MIKQIQSPPSILQLHNLTLQNLQELTRIFQIISLRPILDRPVLADDNLAILYSQALTATSQAIITLGLLNIQLSRGSQNAN